MLRKDQTQPKSGEFSKGSWDHEGKGKEGSLLSVMSFLSLGSVGFPLAEGIFAMVVISIQSLM